VRDVRSKTSAKWRVRDAPLAHSGAASRSTRPVTLRRGRCHGSARSVLRPDEAPRPRQGRRQRYCCRRFSALPRWVDRRATLRCPNCQHRSMESVAASEPWAFTQQHPLTTAEFCREAERRDITIDNHVLRELWRANALAPIAEVRNQRVGAGRPSPVREPYAGSNSILVELKKARDRGRLADPALLGYRPQLKFDRPTAERTTRWWNGLVYSRWQLIALDHFSDALPNTLPYDRKGRRARLRTLETWEQEAATELRCLANLVVALEARYLPEIKLPWVHLMNARFLTSGTCIVKSLCRSRLYQDSAGLLRRSRARPTDYSWGFRNASLANVRGPNLSGAPDIGRGATLAEMPSMCSIAALPQRSCSVAMRTSPNTARVLRSTLAQSGSHRRANA
jgi:hypothetical protein